MIIYPQRNIAAFVGSLSHFTKSMRQIPTFITIATAAPAGRIMASLVGAGGLVYRGGLTGKGGGLAG